MSLQMANEWLWVASFTIWPKGSLTLVVHVWFLFSPPTRLTMASHLKIKDNEARWYCSVHQGADIARGTLERVVHPYPLRHAHTWPRVPSHCVWLLCRVFVLLQCNRQMCTPSWRRESVEGLTPCWTMPSVTTTAGGCVIVIITGSAKPRRLTRTECFVCFLQMGYASRVRVKSSANGCTVCFRTTLYPTPRGTLPWWKRNSRRSSDVSRRAIRTRSASGCWGFLPTWPNGIPRPRPCRPQNPSSYGSWSVAGWPRRCSRYWPRSKSTPSSIFWKSYSRKRTLSPMTTFKYAPCLKSMVDVSSARQCWVNARRKKTWGWTPQKSCMSWCRPNGVNRWIGARVRRDAPNKPRTGTKGRSSRRMLCKKIILRCKHGYVYLGH